jgi:hypothetical protein
VVANAGGVNILYGADGGLQTTDPADQYWMQDAPGIMDQAESGDSFGFGLG